VLKCRSCGTKQREYFTEIPLNHNEFLKHVFCFNNNNITQPSNKSNNHALWLEMKVILEVFGIQRIFLFKNFWCLKTRVFVIYQWNIRQFVYQWNSKRQPTFRRNVLNNKQYGVLADLPLLTDGNEKTTVYNTITKPTVATVGLLCCLKPFGERSPTL
jgi:hypothetical protein